MRSVMSQINEYDDDDRPNRSFVISMLPACQTLAKCRRPLANDYEIKRNIHGNRERVSPYCNSIFHIHYMYTFVHVIGYITSQ